MGYLNDFINGIENNPKLVYSIICVWLVVLAAIASGLTVGLLSIEQLELRMIHATGSPDDRYKANRVLHLISQRHLLMVTLLLTNAIAMEALPVFLDKLIPSVAAVALSVTAILIFGEILPQAYCTGPRQLYIAYASAPFMEILIVVFYPIAKPVSLILDVWFGSEHQNFYDRRALKTLVALHRKRRDLSDSEGVVYDSRRIDDRTILGEGLPHIDSLARSSSSSEGDSEGTSSISSGISGLEDDEIVVIQGALDLTEKTVKDIYTPLEHVYMLEDSTRVTLNTRRQIAQMGFSRIPIYKDTKDNVIGIVLVKALLDLIPVPDELAPTCGDCVIANRSPLFVGTQVSLWSVLNIFQKGKTHMAFVARNPKAFEDRLLEEDIPYSYATKVLDCYEKELLGIITLEDIFEELIQEEIYDEYDFKKKPALASHHYTHHVDLSVPEHVPESLKAAPFSGAARHRIAPKLLNVTESDLTKMTEADISRLYETLSSVLQRFSPDETKMPETTSQLCYPLISKALGANPAIKRVESNKSTHAYQAPRHQETSSSFKNSKEIDNEN